MKKKVLLLLAIIAAVSLSACTNNPASTIDNTGAETEASTVSTEEVRRTGDGSDSIGLPKASSEQVSEPSETESVVSKPTEPSETEATSEQITVVSQPTAAESTETPRPSTQKTKPEITTAPPVSTKPEPTPIVPEPEPTPTAPVVTQEPQPTEPAFDISQYVSYAKSYGAEIGLALDSSAIGCWDTPIEAHTGCIYQERDIRDCLDWYAASGYSAFWVWSVDVGGGNYEIYIGYV